MARWAAVKLDNGLTDYPALAAHLERMLSDPGVRRVIGVEEAA